MSESNKSCQPVQSKYQQKDEEQVDDPQNGLWYFIFYQH
jgi:hypothetical protein